MFSQAMSLEKEVEKFRKARINSFTSQEDTEDCKYSKFMILHIIPETFLDSSYNKPIFALYRKEKKLLGLFQPFNCTYQSFPMIEGMRFTSYYNSEECRLYNNGIAECFYPFFKDLSKDARYPNGYIPWKLIFDRIETTVYNYIDCFCSLLNCERVFVGISIIGCKNATTETDEFLLSKSVVDRNHLVCNPIVFENIYDENTIDHAIKLLQLDFLLSLGVNSQTELQGLIQEIYN